MRQNQKKIGKIKMNECTVVYSDYFTVGSHTHSTTAHVHITCERENIKKH